MDDNEKLTSTVEVDKPKLPLLGKIARVTVISYTAALALMCVIFLLYSAFSTKNMKVSLYYLGEGAVRRICEPAVPEWVDYLFLLLMVTAFVLNVAIWFFITADRIKNGRRMRKRVLLKVATSLIALILGSLGLFKIQQYREYVKYGSDRTCGAEYYMLSHEDRRVVVREWNFLLGGGAEVYQLMEDGSLVQIGNFDTDDGYRHRGNYDVSWKEDGVTFKYYVGSTIQKENCQWVD